MITRRKLNEMTRAIRVCLELSGGLSSCVNRSMISDVLSSEDKQKIKEVERILANTAELIK